MLNDANLSDAANYTISDLNGHLLTVASAKPEQAINPVSVILVLATAMTDTEFYTCTVSSNILTIEGHSVIPPTVVYQWVAGDNRFQVPLNLFTGETSGGLLGNPSGLVFFSPSLNVATPSSIIQVEEVKVCTKAYDSYCIPPSAAVSRVPLYTFGGGLVPTPSPDPYLLNQVVLWAPFPCLSDATFNLTPTEEDTFPAPVDTSCSILIRQPYALGYVALLNDPAWFIFDHEHGTSVPPMFITAKNLSPIPPGPESLMVLHVALGGTSRFAPATAKKLGHTSSSMVGSSRLWAGAGPPPVVLAEASLSGGASVSARVKEKYAGRAVVNGVSVLRALATEGGTPPTVLFASSALHASAGVRRKIAAEVHGASALSARATVTRGAQASVTASAHVTPTATAHWKARAEVSAGSSVAPEMKAVRKAESFPVGEASVLATATP
jgi:hypothetical protein